MRNSKRILLASAIALIASGTVADSDEPVEGATSTGSLQVTLVKNEIVRITDLDDVALVESGGDYLGRDDVCVVSTHGPYNVIATGSSGPGFRLVSGANTLDYTVTWTGETGVAKTLAEGIALGNNTGTADATCSTSGGTNTSVEIKVAGSDFDRAAEGSYADTLTIIIAPE